MLRPSRLSVSLPPPEALTVNGAENMLPRRENRGATVENTAGAEESACNIFDFEANVAHSEKHMVEETSDNS